MVEVILAITIFALFTLGIFNLALDTLQRDSKIELETMANFYVQEGIEVVRNLRDRNFLLLTNGDYGLDLVNGQWQLVTAPEDVDGFYSRTITIEDVYRDVNGDIASMGTFDPNTKKITSEVSWLVKDIFPRSASFTTYLTNWSGDNWIQTTCDELNTGTFDTTVSVSTPAPPEDNCGLELDIIESSSEFFSSANIGEHGNDVFVDGAYAYVATAKSQDGFAVVNKSDPANMYMEDSLDIGGKGRYITKSGNYVYIGVDNNKKSLAIVNVSSPSSLQLVTNEDYDEEGSDLKVSGSTLYLGLSDSDDSFLIIDVTNKSNPVVLSTMDLDSEVQAAAIDGNYIYLGFEEDQEGFRVIDISNPSDPQEIASLDLGEEVNDIFISGIFAYVGTEESDESLQVVNISNPASPQIVASLDVGGEIQGLTIVGDYLYAAVDDQNSGLAAVNIATPSSPTLSYNLDINGKGTAIDNDGSYLYITVDTANPGLVVVGTTESSIVTSGSYESAILDTGSSDTRYNYIAWEHTEVPGSNVKFQIRTASSEAGLTAEDWVGSDGTVNTFYETSRTPIILDPASSGPRYIQFKAFIESDGTNTATIESVTINYTP